MSERTAGSPKHKAGGPNSQYNADGTKKKKKKRDPVNSPNQENVLPGTGSRYKKDGSKRDLGVGWGP